MRLSLMIEGQEDVSWEQWLALGGACERAGLEALFRSDHYLSVDHRPDRGSLDAWSVLSALAHATERIRLGTLVSPVTFRHPSVLAKCVVTLDHVSDGRAELGMGAGWHEPEHRSYGFPFPSSDVRLQVLEEQIEIVHRSWQSGPFDFRGRHYQLDGLDALPKPVQRPHPNLIVGGSGGVRSLAVAARWADEYNTVFRSLELCRERRKRVIEAWERAGRDPESVTFSVMAGCLVAQDEAEVIRRARSLIERRGSPTSERDWLAKVRRAWIVGTVDEAVEQLRALEDIGAGRVMLQHLAHDDLAMVEVLGEIAARLR